MEPADYCRPVQDQNPASRRSESNRRGRGNARPRDIEARHGTLIGRSAIAPRVWQARTASALLPVAMEPKEGSEGPQM